ncbi:MAG: L,D-transpeptidase family protein [Candidatus Omnitrophota bacterium]
MKKKLFIVIAAILILSAVLIVMNMRRGPCLLQPGAFGASSGANALLSQAKDFQAKGDLAGAKGAYKKLLEDHFDSRDVMEWQKRIEELNLKLLFSPVVTDGSLLYEIKPGDTLSGIAKEFNTTADLIKKSNNITDDKIFPGRNIKVWNGSFNIFVDKSQNLLILKFGEEVIKTYAVSTGKDNSTPPGDFTIVNKLDHPTWFKAGAVVPADSPENILGTRWLGFNLPGYGIHGTTDPASLGSQVTQGCVRMSNTEVEELYTIVPTGTEVTIVD